MARFVEGARTKFIDDVPMYERWKEFWINSAEQGSVLAKRGPPVAVDDERFLDTLISWQDPQFVITDGGELAEDVTAETLPEAADFLFNEIVSRKSAETSRDSEHQPNIVQVSKVILDKAGLLKREDFRSGRHATVRMTRHNVERDWRYDFLLKQGDEPRAIFQCLQLDNQKSVSHAGLQIEAAQNVFGIKREHCAIMLRMPTSKEPDRKHDLEYLNAISEVINVAKPKAAIAAVNQVALGI